jgi:uncharacterized lipoprotein YbaY
MKGINMNKLILSVSLVVASLVTAGCGSDTVSVAPAPALIAGTDVPVAAADNVAGTLDFIRQVVAMVGEDLLPLNLGDVVFRTDDTSELSPN